LDELYKHETQMLIDKSCAELSNPTLSRLSFRVNTEIFHPMKAEVA